MVDSHMIWSCLVVERHQFGTPRGTELNDSRLQLYDLDTLQETFNDIKLS